MDHDGFSSATGAAASPGATTRGPVAEALLEGAEYDAETEDSAEAFGGGSGSGGGDGRATAKTKQLG